MKDQVSDIPEVNSNSQGREYRNQTTVRQRVLLAVLVGALAALPVITGTACSKAHPNPTNTPPATEVREPTATVNLTPARLRDKSAEIIGTPTFTPTSTPVETGVVSEAVFP